MDLAHRPKHGEGLSWLLGEGPLRNRATFWNKRRAEVVGEGMSRARCVGDVVANHMGYPPGTDWTTS